MSNGHGRSTEGFGISRQQSVDLIVRTCLENGVSDHRQIAYVLATAQHETRNFTAPEEDFGRSQARKLGYRGGEEYFGRGYVHLTHRDNYERMDRLLGLNGQLVRDPGLATDPEIAAKIMVIGMRDGLFTGKRLDRYIDEDSNDLYNARRTVNGVTPTRPWSVKAAQDCERYAEAWEQRVPALVEAARRAGVAPAPSRPSGPTASPPDGAYRQLKQGTSSAEVTQLQERLNALGYRDAEGRRLAEDGDFGSNTREAVVAFQKANGLQGLGVVGPRTRELLERAQPTREPSQPRALSPSSAPRNDGHAIYDEAYRHFLAGGNRFEYGRGDMRLSNSEGNRRTDSSRTGQDLDGDGLRGVDCSYFVWRGLKDAGYGVPATPFSTHALFNGNAITRYSREHFDLIPPAEARRDNGSLRPGDIILFKDRNSAGQHVGIFKGYDADGRIQFIGSQVSTGPAQAEAGQGSYWNGGRFEIVGAQRAKPEFQVRAPLHAGGTAATERAPAGGDAPRATATPAQRAAADADGRLEMGERGPAVATLQRRLAELGYRAPDGRPLDVDGRFGTDTRDALQRFQREHGLQGLGVAGPKTEIALGRAERALMSHPSHPHHALYAQVLEKVHAEERARGLEPGHHSQRIAAALAVECLREGITRVDRVELNRDVTLVRGVQVSAVRDEPGLNRATDGISVPQAARQTLAESSEQIHQVAVNLQAQQRDQQRRTAPAFAN